MDGESVDELRRYVEERFGKPQNVEKDDVEKAMTKVIEEAKRNDRKAEAERLQTYWEAIDKLPDLVVESLMFHHDDSSYTKPPKDEVADRAKDVGEHLTANNLVYREDDEYYILDIKGPVPLDILYQCPREMNADFVSEDGKLKAFRVPKQRG